MPLIGTVDRFPSGWTSFNPTATAQTGTITSFFGQDGAYKIAQDTVFFWTYAVINNPGTGAGALRFGLPFDIWIPSGSAFSEQIVAVRLALGSGANVTGIGYFVPGGSGNYDRIWTFKYDGTTPIGAGNGIYISGVYQKA